MTQQADQQAKEGRAPGVKWFEPPALKLHAVMVLGVALSSAAAWFEWTRALSGHHEIAWVYAFEWPLFAVMGIYLWWKLLHAEQDGAAGRLPRSRRSPTARTAARTPGPDDPDLAAWQAYLARLHADDPPGGPPTG